MQNFNIETDETGKELIDHGSSMFPIAGYDELFSKFLLGEVPWHWHEEIELVIVLEGSTQVLYPEGHVELKKGDGIFINSNVLHRMIRTSPCDCHIINFVLRPEFIAGRVDSTIYRKYIHPICSNTSLPIITFDPVVDYERAIIDAIKKAFEIYSNASLCFELALRTYLSESWILLCTNRPYLLNAPTTETEDQKRIRKLVHFIHQHYQEKITVKNLSIVASISESECYRLFRKTLTTTPNEYIQSHRLQLAPSLLLGTDLSVITISQNLGFGSPSYFTKLFKATYHLTPMEFRKLRPE